MAMNNRYDCVVFDLDGTLLYTLESINLAVNETMRICGYPEHTLEGTKTLVNYGSEELVRRALPEGKKYPEEVARVHEIYFPLLQKYATKGTTRPYDGVTELCRQLKERGVTLCVMSNKPHDAAVDCIRSYFGEGLFDVVRGSVPGKFVKPDAAFSLDVIKCAGAEKERCVFVGDSVVDMQTAKGAGCPVIWVRWGYGTRENICADPEYIAEVPSDILKIVTGEENG